MDSGPAGIAIVGGGASGALVAAHLLRRPSSPFHVVLVERAGRVAEGIAYSTTSKCHLLNVPARSMSAFEDDPGHFVRWLASRGLPAAADDFVPRTLYGRYLRETLWPQGGDGTPSPTFGTVFADVVDVSSGPQGPELVLDNGHTIAAKAVVLSTGMLMRQFPASLSGDTTHPRCIADPWAHDALAGIPPSATVTLLGSGLTAIDVLLALQESGHRGPVHAISRHGLLPRAHRTATQGREPLERLCRDLEGGEVRSLLHQVRQMMQAPEAGGAEAGGAEAGGADWRDLVDALRPEVPRLWSRLSGDEQLRFRRHLERLWNVYRHRMAPPVAQAVDELQSSGIFFVHAGEVDAVEDVGPALHLQVKLRARARPYAWRTDWLVNCTGPDPHLFERGQPLMDALLARGLARPGPIGMGLGTDERGRVLDAQGQPSPWLWAVGPLRQGQLLESTAVPEIRVQARDIALDIDRSLVDLCTGSTDAPVGACRGSKAQPPTAQLVAS
jgi:uncharacterized NAD(P)/FAD-binding protein YdhS